jgi:hypothetical protein
VGKRAELDGRADHEAISRTEWFGGLWLDGGEPCLPAEALMATFVGAASSLRGNYDRNSSKSDQSDDDPVRSIGNN